MGHCALLGGVELRRPIKWLGGATVAPLLGGHVMTFTQSIRICLSKFATFSGRASRPEYWFFFLFVTLVGVIAAVLDAAVFAAPTPSPLNLETSFASAPLQAVVGFGLLLPHMAVAVRRMHDTARSGWFVFLPSLLAMAAVATALVGIGMAGLFQHGGNFDILLTNLTLSIVIPTLIVLLFSPLLVLWWLTRPSHPDATRYGPDPSEVPQ
jgi:uncharacterized membrane protein YhaH (DUF805 family)